MIPLILSISKISVGGKYIFFNEFVLLRRNPSCIESSGVGTSREDLEVCDEAAETASSIVVRREELVLDVGVVDGELDGDEEGLEAGALSRTIIFSLLSESSIQGAPPHLAAYMRSKVFLSIKSWISSPFWYCRKQGRPERGARLASFRIFGPA